LNSFYQNTMIKFHFKSSVWRTKVDQTFIIILRKFLKPPKCHASLHSPIEVMHAFEIIALPGL
jgi:hypothetical protein